MVATLLLFLCGRSRVVDDCENMEQHYASKLAGYSRTENKEKVYEECQKDLLKCPKLAVIFELMARIEYDDGYDEDALENYRKALYLTPDNLPLLERINDLRNDIRRRRREAQQSGDRQAQEVVAVTFCHGISLFAGCLSGPSRSVQQGKTPH